MDFNCDFSWWSLFKILILEVRLFKPHLQLQVSTCLILAPKIRISGFRAGSLSMGTRVCSILRAQDLQQSLTSFWYYHNPSAKPYTVSIRYDDHHKWAFHGISFRFLVCQIWSFEVAHVSSYFSRTYSKLWTTATESTESFIGPTIAHLKYISVILNGYFAEFDFVLWFESYDQLKQPMSVK